MHLPLFLKLFVVFPLGTTIRRVIVGPISSLWLLAALFKLLRNEIQIHSLGFILEYFISLSLLTSRFRTIKLAAVIRGLRFSDLLSFTSLFILFFYRDLVPFDEGIALNESVFR
eukprot:TRINITY_DN984_c0_g1_i5.p2 TRINITY_DN984_c0_g1~~TRINITY_DN984_c0_g1_i5.p2  ORF type:complete len:114 (-),score=10.08 TRINITY_DN984_c0_g1_i5:195-536(-)